MFLMPVEKLIESLHLFLRLLIISCPLLCASQARAIGGDDQAPIHIKADTAELDETKGTAVYEGDVVVTQGTTVLKAAKVVIHSTDQALTKIVATGQPASLSQAPEDKKPGTEASGNLITYLHADQTIQLEGKAKLVQGNNQFQGNIITYNSKTRVVSASGSNSGEPGEGNGRVELIIHPKALKPQSSAEHTDSSSATSAPQASEGTPPQSDTNPDKLPELQ